MNKNLNKLPGLWRYVINISDGIEIEDYWCDGWISEEGRCIDWFIVYDAKEEIAYTYCLDK